MLIVFLIISLIIAILGFMAFEEFGFFTALIPIGVIGAIIVNLVIVVDGRVIDEKIAMYTEENEKIEKDIDKLVDNYMEFESSTLIELKDDSSITLVSLYPELKSDELVKAQIETYRSNNKTIRKLKKNKLEVSSAKWWLYFGK